MKNSEKQDALLFTQHTFLFGKQGSGKTYRTMALARRDPRYHYMTAYQLLALEPIPETAEVVFIELEANINLERGGDGLTSRLFTGFADNSRKRVLVLINTSVIEIEGYELRNVKDALPYIQQEPQESGSTAPTSEGGVRGRTALQTGTPV